MIQAQRYLEKGAVWSPFASYILLAGALVVATPLAAEPIALIQPIDCTLGDTCYIQQFMDHDPSDNASDFRCQAMTYDRHRGTDFALPSLAAQARGVDVLAAADGTITGTRDSMPDILQGTANAPDLDGRDCGNGVAIDHGDGWTAQYCHLARGSITVRTGQTVRAGDTIAQVGLSGRTQFPHLHMTLRKDGEDVDPFEPDGIITCGAPATETLFQPPLPAPAGGIIAAGFADAIPEYSAIKRGAAQADTIATDDAALVIWGYFFAGQPDDTIKMTITGPEGIVHDTTMTLDRQQALLSRSAGRRTPASGWPLGEYTGDIILLRDGIVLDHLTTRTTVTD